jgi:hypothetical protein
MLQSSYDAPLPSDEEVSSYPTNARSSFMEPDHAVRRSFSLESEPVQYSYEPAADLAALPASSAPRTLLRIAKARPVGNSET